MSHRTRALWCATALVALGAAGALALGALGASGDRPGLIVTPGMVEPVAYDAYDPNPVTGRTLRLPPDGTVPQGATRHQYGSGTAEAERAGRELINPVAPTVGAVAQGKLAFETFCVPCHGPRAEGDGPVAGRFPPPPPLAVRAKGLPDGTLWHIITSGQGLMPAYGVQVPPTDRWRIVHYLRTLQGLAPGAGPTVAPVPDAGRAP